MCCAVQGKDAKAEPFFERCQKIQETALGPEHPRVATTLNNRAGLLMSQVRAVGCSQFFLPGRRWDDTWDSFGSWQAAASQYCSARCTWQVRGCGPPAS